MSIQTRAARIYQSGAAFGRRCFLAAAPGVICWAAACDKPSGNNRTDAGPSDASGDADDEPQADTCRPLANSFGAYNFTIEGREPREQLQFLKSLGYQSLVTEWKGAESYRAFLSDSLVAAGDVKLVATLVTMDAGMPIDVPHWLNVFETLKAGSTRTWLLVSGSKDQQQISERLGALAELAASISDIPIVLYPHWRTAIETTEESADVLRLLKRSNVRTSLHLCHELKAGNVGRLRDVIEGSSAHLDLVSINGAYLVDGDPEGWSSTILPLDEGDLDVSNGYLRPLIAAGYEGPVLLHTYGIRERPEEHYPRSMMRFASSRRC